MDTSIQAYKHISILTRTDRPPEGMPVLVPVLVLLPGVYILLYCIRVPPAPFAVEQVSQWQEWEVVGGSGGYRELVTCRWCLTRARVSFIARG